MIEVNQSHNIFYFKYITSILSVLKQEPLDDKSIFSTIKSKMNNPNFIELQVALSESVRRGIIQSFKDPKKLDNIMYIKHS
jgi:hypothetical protein